MSLLGYTDNGTFEVAKESPAFHSWLGSCTQALEWLSEQPEAASSTAKVSAPRGATTSLATSVSPLLGDIKWNQTEPYNLMCQIRSSGSNQGNAPTCCVATAMAQVMGYYQWPIKGTGTHTNANDDTQSRNFSQCTTGQTLSLRIQVMLLVTLLMPLPN